jgi:hypothetical protein
MVRATGSDERQEEHAMYAQIVRRAPSHERREETMQRAGREFFPKLRQASGFVAFYLVAEEDGLNTAVTIWEDRARAEAFLPQMQAWNGTLEALGNWQQSRTAGEVITHVTPQQ